MSIYEKQGGLCALSGIPMTYTTGKGKVDTNISIDQIIPSNGYIEGNVQLVCCAANQMKWTRSVEELLEWCQAILEHRAKH